MAAEMYRAIVGDLATSSVENAVPRVHSSRDVLELIGGEMAGYEQEHLRVLLLDTKNGVRRSFDLYVGTVSGTTVRVAELFREAVRDNAPHLIVAHNHPSGDTTPSPEDVRLTRVLVEVGQLLDIDVLDHLVIGGTPAHPAFLSLRAHKLGFS